MGKKLSRQLMTSASLKVDTQSSERLDFDILVPPYCASFCVFKPCSIAFSNSDKGSYAECRRLCAFMCFPVPALVIAEPPRAVSELFAAMSDFSVFHFYHSIFPSLEKKILLSSVPASLRAPWVRSCWGSLYGHWFDDQPDPSMITASSNTTAQRLGFCIAETSLDIHLYSQTPKQGT